MIYISHRGNINGPAPEKENNPDYIQIALDDGFHAEIDVWLVDYKFYLGHDKPIYEIHFSYLQNDKLWCHAKNVEALNSMINMPEVQCFSHDNDSYVLTNHNYIWTFPSKNNKLMSRSIAVLPELVEDWDLDYCYGVCSDYVVNYRIKN